MSQPTPTSTTRIAQDLVVRTRFVPPRLRPQIVPRPRVDSALARVLEYPLTVVKAEAGYGKTTAVASWLAASLHPHMWYHVGDPEADPRTFLRHLIHALQGLFPGAGHDALVSLDELARTPRAWRAVADALSNDLLDRLTSETVLVLDDYDSVNVPEVNAIVDRLVETMPPHLHLVITARTMPSLRNRSRWRASGEMLEVTRSELAFTADEVVALFTHRESPALTLDAARMVTAETEGWPIALQMVSDGLAGADAGALDTLLRRIPGPSELLFDYLADEVFLRQPAGMQRFLGESASLRRLDPQACDFTLEITDSAELLRSLERQSLFVTRDASFRYHKLFGDFLLRRSGVDQVRRRRLHERAAMYYQSAGETEEAVHHLLAAGDYTNAASLLTGIAPPMLANGRHHALAAWLEQFPAEALDAMPALLHARAETLRLAGRYAEAIPSYDRAIVRFRDANDNAGEVRAMRGKALVYLDTVQPAHAEPLIRRAFGAVRGDAQERRAFYLLLAENRLNAGELRRAERMYVAVHRAGGPLPPPRLYVRQGRFADVRTLVEAERRVEASARLVPRAPRSHRETAALLAWTEALVGEADLARQHAEESLEVGHALGSPNVECIALARLGLAWLAGLEVDVAKARAACLEAIRVAQRMGVPRFEVEPLLGLMLIAGRERHAEEVERLARHALGICDDAGDRWVRALVQLTRAIALATCEHVDAEPRLREVRAEATPIGHVFVTCFAAAWHALVLSRAGQSAAAREASVVALEQASREGYGFLFNGTSLFAPRDPSQWRPILRRAQEHPLVGSYARQLSQQFDANPEAQRGPRAVLTPGTAPLYIQALGNFRAWRRGHEIERAAWGREKAVHLLQFLVSHRGHAVHREQVLDALWQSAAPAAAATGLRVALSALREAIAADDDRDTEFIKREGDTLRLAMESGVHVDADEFGRQLKVARGAESSDPDHAITLYEAALASYRGDFLAEHRYTTWADTERQLRRGEYLEGAERLSRLLLAMGEIERALRWAEAILEIDPLWEGAYVLQMEAYARQDNRALAVRAFKRCQKRLRASLGVEPSERTTALFTRISRGPA